MGVGVAADGAWLTVGADDPDDVDGEEPPDEPDDTKGTVEFDVEEVWGWVVALVVWPGNDRIASKPSAPAARTSAATTVRWMRFACAMRSVMSPPWIGGSETMPSSEVVASDPLLEPCSKPAEKDGQDW